MKRRPEVVCESEKERIERLAIKDYDDIEERREAKINDKYCADEAEPSCWGGFGGLDDRYSSASAMDDSTVDAMLFMAVSSLCLGALRGGQGKAG